jgi:hypothetical protein
MVTPVFLLILLAIGVWLLTSGRPKKGFLPDFGKLLDRSEFVEGYDNWLIRRSFLKGEFRGRKVVVMLQLGKKRAPANGVVDRDTRRSDDGILRIDWLQGRS